VRSRVLHKPLDFEHLLWAIESQPRTQH